MQHDLLQVSALGRSFDYIVSSGVLHHLVDPDAGLRALRDVLRPHGSMCLMLYNAHARHGIYMLQEAFRILGFGQVQADVDLVKATLAALPAHHQAKLMAADSEDLKYDAGVVDMLLHPQDRPYTVKECYEFLERNGLRFQVWADPLDFSVQANVPADHPLYRRLAMLPKREQAHAIDLLYQRRPTNVFLACHPGRTDTDLDFTGEAFLGYVPSVRQPIEMSIVRNVVQEEVVRVKRRWSDITLPRKASLVISRVDGAKTCRQIIEEIAGDATVEQAASVIRHTFSDLADMGHLLFRAKP